MSAAVSLSALNRFLDAHTTDRHYIEYQGFKSNHLPHLGRGKGGDIAFVMWHLCHELIITSNGLATREF